MLGCILAEERRIREMISISFMIVFAVIVVGSVWLLFYHLSYIR